MSFRGKREKEIGSGEKRCVKFRDQCKENLRK